MTSEGSFLNGEVQTGRNMIRGVLLALVVLSPLTLASHSNQAPATIISDGIVRCDLEVPKLAINCDEQNRFDHIIVINTTGRHKVTALAEWTANSASSQEMQFRISGNRDCHLAGEPFRCYDQTIRGSSPLRLILEGIGASDPTMSVGLTATPYSCESVDPDRCAGVVRVVRNQSFTVTWTLE
jgi:hypothetical protein